MTYKHIQFCFDDKHMYKHKWLCRRYVGHVSVCPFHADFQEEASCHQSSMAHLLIPRPLLRACMKPCWRIEAQQHRICVAIQCVISISGVHRQPGVALLTGTRSSSSRHPSRSDQGVCTVWCDWGVSAVGWVSRRGVYWSAVDKVCQDPVSQVFVQITEIRVRAISS